MKACPTYPGGSGGIARVLVAALLIQFLLPLHFHTHVQDDLHGIEHQVHSHTLVDPGAIQHYVAGDAHDLKAAPDTVTKQGAAPVFTFVMLFWLFTLLPPVSVASGTERIPNRDRSIRSGRYVLAPPLRAPPVT